MKLSSDVLETALSSLTKIRTYGPRIKKLCLDRPQLCEGEHFPAETVVVADGGKLPEAAEFEQNVLVIAVGSMPSEIYLSGRCTCFVAEECSSVANLMNRLQRIYNRYDAWDESLRQMIYQDDGFQEIADLAYPIFQNPVTIINENFKMLAVSSVVYQMEELSTCRPDENGNLRRENMSKEMKTNQKLDLSDRRLMVLQQRNPDFEILSKNLFIGNYYAGNVSVPMILQKRKKGDEALFAHFAEVIQQAVNVRTPLINMDLQIMQRTLSAMLENAREPLTLMQRKYLDEMNANNDNYVCCVIRMDTRAQDSLSIRYIRTLFANSFPYSPIMEHEASIVALINNSKLHCSVDEASRELQRFAESLHLLIAISCEFSDLYLFQSYYRQACLAFEYGNYHNPELCYFRFEDYKLDYMLVSCFGEFAPQLLCSSGVRRLIEYDKASKAECIHTLRVYLNNNMSITKTAADLYIHRSTFLARLKKIESMLDKPLDDPSYRLYLELILTFLKTGE